MAKYGRSYPRKSKLAPHLTVTTEFSGCSSTQAKRLARSRCGPAPKQGLPDGLNISAAGDTSGRKENAVGLPDHNKMGVRPSLTRAYDEAWALYEARCLWNVRRVVHPTPDDARDVAHRLRQYGNMSARRLAARIEGEASAT